MSDVVERLTALSEEYRDHDPDVVAFTAEAAAEITRLRAELDWWQHAAKMGSEALGEARRDLAAAQERERVLREALERLASMEGFSGNFRMKLNNEAAELKARIDFARAALGEPQ